MIPHDMSGLPINRANIVAVALKDSGGKLCFGVVSEVCYSTGVVVVQTVMMNRINLVEEYRLLFPANQCILVSKDRFKEEIPEHKIILDLSIEHDS